MCGMEQIEQNAEHTARPIKKHKLVGKQKITESTQTASSDEEGPYFGRNEKYEQIW